jgi:serine/threonine-protein kinase
MRDLEVGDELGRYRIERVLGAGGMGRVYGAYDSVLRRRVALKVLHALESDDTAPGALLREARAAAAFTHPNAVAIYDVGEHEGTPFIAMELLEGRSLRAFVGDVTVSTERKVRWLIGVAKALGAAHDAGLVHRDVKPGNVLVGADDVVKVLDFGIAKRKTTGEDATNEPETAAGSLKGTPRYMAPEQILGQPVDARTDEFAWGLLAYELFCGVHPWASSSGERSVVEMIVLDEPRAPSKVAPNVTPALEKVILRALAKEPAARFGSMAEVASALERAIEPAAAVEERDPTAATVAAPIAPPSKARPSRKTPLAIAGLVVVAAAGALVTSRVLHAPASASPTTLTDAAPVPTPMMALPRPPSAHPDAVAAFLSGMQAMHDGSYPLAHREYDRALTLDPSLAIAALHLALMDQTTATAKARERWQLASAQRSTLTPRDQALLDTIEPYVGRDPSDPKESAKRLRALVARYPADAELQELLAEAVLHEGEMHEVIDASTKALAIDPTFAHASVLRGIARAYLGEFDAASKDFDECLAHTHDAAGCRAYRTELRVRTLGCAGLEPDAREWMSVDPTWFKGPELLAEVEIARGDSARTIDEALHQVLEHDLPAERATDELRYAASTAILRGDFESAQRPMEKWSSMIESSQLNDHAKAARSLMMLFDETSKPADAEKVARDFLERSPSWTVRTQGEDTAVAGDPRPVALALAHRSREIDAWAEEWRARLPPFYAPYIWANGHARAASSPETARAALDSLARFGGAPPVFAPQSRVDGYVGRTYLLAGRASDALPYLKRAAGQCALYWPIEQTRATFDLGDALAKTGDVPGACDAFARVLARWGSAKPRSVTADAARSRSRELGCAAR